MAVNYTEIAEILHHRKDPLQRVDWEDYFLVTALAIAARASCLRMRFGAVVVAPDKRIVATGYNGAPAGTQDSLEAGFCLRQALGVPHGQRYEICRAVHAEQNAIQRANYQELASSTIYIAGWDPQKKKLVTAAPCSMCQRMLLGTPLHFFVYLTAEGTIEKRSILQLKQDPLALIASDFGQSMEGLDLKNIGTLTTKKRLNVMLG